MPESKKIEYKSEGKKIPTLEVPPDLVTPSADNRFDVPGAANKPTTYSQYTNDKKADVAKGDTSVLPDVGNMRIERDGTQRWLLVPGVPPEKLWDKVKEFWQENGLALDVEDPNTGVMETQWAENRAKIPQDFIRNTLGKLIDSIYSTSERDKYRTRLERTPDGSTEIYLSQRGMQEVFITENKDDTRWEPRPPDPDLEAEMLRRLMVRLGSTDAQAKAQLAASATQTDTRASFDRNTGVLTVNEPFDRSWRRIGLALDRVNFTVEDRDRSQGIYYVRYVDPDADVKKGDTGILSKLAFWKSSDKDIDKNVQYRIYVKDIGDNSTVQVLTREGGAAPVDTSRKILNLLYEQLK